jgi:hypothetical protein
VSTKSSFGVILPIGPNPLELDRAKDLIDSLKTFEEGRCQYLVVIDDTPTDRGLCEKLVAKGSLTKVFVNPRKGRGIAFSDGMGVGVAVATNWLARETDVDFALRLDTDSLVIAPFAERLARKFAQNPRTGLLGTIHKYPSGEVRDKREFNGPLLARLVRPLSITRMEEGAWPTIHQSVFGRGRSRRRFIERAIGNGYDFGDGCQGGGYALSRSLLNALAKDREFANPFLFSAHTRILEDTMMTIATYAAGFVADDYNQRDEVFGVVHLCLPGSPEELIKAGYGVIHSLKTYGDFNEEQTRSFFKTARASVRIADL